MPVSEHERGWQDRCATFPRGYLPMDCPACGRRRLLYGVNEGGGVIYVECEKCGANSDETLRKGLVVDADSNHRLHAEVERLMRHIHSSEHRAVVPFEECRMCATLREGGR